VKPGMTIFVAAMQVAALVAASAAAAQGAGLAMRDYRGVAYVTGGIGSDERERLAELAGDFNVRMIFAQGSGEYLAGVRVIVTGEDGRTVLDAGAEGPLLLARLPPGRYRVSAAVGGARRDEAVQVAPSALKTVYFYW
jgi:hypothetical protein